MSDYESSILQELSSIGQATGSVAPVDPVIGNEQIAAAPNSDDYEALIFKELSGLNPNAGAVPRTPQKQVDIAPDALSSLVIAAQRGAGANRDLEKDLTTLEDADLVKIYGQGADALRGQMYNELKAQQKTLNTNRTTAQIMGDTVNKAAQGAIGFIGGGLSLSAGAGNYVGSKINDGLGIEDNATTNFADSVAPAISEATTAAVGWLNNFTSDQTQETDRLISLQTDYESGVNKAERDAAVAAGGNSTIETMKMVGKNFLDGGAEILDNPTATSNLIAGALGSLGPSAKVVGSVAKMVESTGTYKAAQLAAAIDNTGMGKILGMAADATKAGATAGAVGLTEAAGTYQQTMQEVLDMPEEDLMKSAEYFHLVENGMNPAQARTKVAERTAREAFFTALPLATTTSIMALKFDANPLKAMGDAGFQNGLAGIGREVLGQTVEEALQSGSSEFSRNLSFQENINPAQELFTGVGEQAAAGAISGAGMAGVLGIPSAAGAVGNIAADNMSGPAAPSGPTPFGPNDPNAPSSLDPALSAALLDKAQSDIAKMEGQVGPLTEYQQNVLRVLRSNQDNPDNLYQLYVPNDRSPAGEKAFNESLNDITPSGLSTFMDAAKAKAETATAAAKDLYSKVSAGAAEGFAKAKEAVVEKANEINTKQTPEAAAETVQAAANSVVAVYDWNTQTGQDAPEGIKQATAPKAEDVPTELQDTLSSAPDIVSTVSSLVQNLTTGAIKVKDLSNDGLLYAYDHIEKLRAALPTMPKDVQESVKAMLNSPSVAKIQARVKGLDLSTKVGNSVSAIKRMVRINPTKVDPIEVAKILEQRDRTDLTDEDVRLMKSAAKISAALDNHAGNKVQIGKDEIVDFTKPVNAPILDNQNARVSRNLQVEGFNGLRSINDYASDIFRAAQSGNPEAAVDAAGNIYSGTAVAGEYGNFTQHLINKVEALNQSHDTGGKFVQYESLNAKSRKMIPAGQAGGAKAVAHHPGNPGSTKNAQAIYNDAKAAVEVYNTLVETFPQMFPDGKKTLPDLKVTSSKAEETQNSKEVVFGNPFKDSVLQEVVYHASNDPNFSIKDIKTIRPNDGANGSSVWLKGSLGSSNNIKVGFYVTLDVIYGAAMAGATMPLGTTDLSTVSKEDMNGVVVHKLYVNITKPYYPVENDPITPTSISLEQMENLKREGFDGIIDGQDIIVFDKNQVAEAEPKPAQPEAQPKSEATAEGEAVASNQKIQTQGELVFGEDKFPKGYKTDTYTIKWDGPIVHVHLAEPVKSITGFDLDGKKLSFASSNDTFVQVDILDGGIEAIVTGKKRTDGTRPTLLFSHSATKVYEKGKGVDVRNDGGHALSQISEVIKNTELVQFLLQFNSLVADGKISKEMDYYPIIQDTFGVDILPLAIAKMEWFLSKNFYSANGVRYLAELKALQETVSKSVKIETPVAKIPEPVVGAKLDFNPKLPAVIQKKDQAKADKATKFIGRGSKNSSTNRYRISFGDRANTGSYTSSDVVFISAEGQRGGRVLPNYAEIQLALDAGATIITDVPADRARAYNSGERDVAAYLESHGYTESSPGTWTLTKTEVKPKVEAKAGGEAVQALNKLYQEDLKQTDAWNQVKNKVLVSKVKEAFLSLDKMGLIAMFKVSEASAEYFYDVLDPVLFNGRVDSPWKSFEDFQKDVGQTKGEAVQTNEQSTPPKVEERKATAEEVGQILDLFKKAYGDLKFPKLPIVITDVIDGKENRLGQMGHNGTMKLVPAVFENKDNMKKATHIVFHELGHWVDKYGEYPVSDSRDWAKAVAEFDAFVDNVANETQKRFLGYILSHRGRDTYASEVFADLFSIMGTRPDFISKNFPLAQKLMTEALNEATGNTAKPTDETIIKLQDGTIITETTITSPDGTVFTYVKSDIDDVSPIFQTIAEVYGIVFYRFFKDAIRNVYTMSGGVPVAAMFDEDTGDLYIHEEILKGFVTDDAQSLHVVFHELGHVVDSLFETHGVSKSEEFASSKGVIQTEIADAVQDLNSFTSILLTSYALQHVKRETRNAEMFAELFSVFTYSPETIQKELPSVYDYFRKIIEKYSDEDYEKVSRTSRQRKYRDKSRQSNSSSQNQNQNQNQNLNGNTTTTSPDTTEDVSTRVETPEVAERNSLFTKIFTESKEPAPFTSVDDVIAQVNELGDHMNVFTDFLRANVDAVLKRLNARLSSIKFDDKKSDSVIEALRKDPEKVLLYRDFKNLAFVDSKTGLYDPTIASLAISLVLDELSGAHPAPPSLLRDRMTEDGVSFTALAAMGKKGEQLLKDYMQSISIRQIAENLARDLPAVLGLQINDEARLGDARGSLEDLIKEILVSIAETNDGGLLRIADVPTSEGITQAIVLSETMKNLQISMGLDGRSGMSKLLFPENISGPSLNAPPEFVAQKQSRGGIETSTAEREVLKNMQSIGHSRTPVASLLKALGPDVMFILLGGKDVSHLADNHPLRRSIEGKNLSIIRDYQDAVEIAQAMEDAGPDSKVYYPVGISRVGRHQMQGPNPQNNKILRHSVTSTISVLDMRNNPTHQDYFWLTVAQAAGMAKAEKKNHQKILAETEDQFRSLYRDAIFLAREFLITGEIDAAAFDLAIRGINGIPENSIMPAGTKIVETEVTMAVIDAVMAVAALDEARADGKEDEFTTSLSFEIDGLTDGPGNMLVNMGQGLLTLEDYENLRRVGYFLGERNMTTNTYYGQQGNKDFYEMTTQYAEASMALDKSAAELMQALARFAAYFGDFKIEVGPDGRMAYKMTRNTAKSPVTKKGYGSGVGGIARGISEDMVLEFYRFMTEDSNGNPAEELGYREFVEDFKMLFNDEFNSETPWDRSFFDKASVARFTTVVEKTLGRILTEAAEKMLGSEIQKVNDTLVFMTNIQATYLQLAFEHRVRAILVARGADPKKPIRYQDLTVGEMRQIVSDLKALAPVYYNGVQALGLGAFEGAISENTEFSSTMDGRLRMKSTLPLPSDAGVKVIPYLNIGRGDAMMMNLTYGRENFPTRSIPIFDGVSLAIADIGAYSDLINEAVAENWNQDLLEPVLRDLMRFSQSVPANEQHLLQAAYREVAKMQPKSIKFKSLENVAQTLAGMVKSNQARKTVFAKIPRSVNHMAGADRTVNLGPEGFMDRDEINALIAEEMRNPTPKAEEEPADPKNQFNNLSVMTGMEMLRALLTTVKNPRLVEVLKTLVKANPNVRVITGNAAQIAAHRLNEGADPVLTTRKGSGFFDEKNQTIYLVSKNHETLVHELVHFTTFALVHKVYMGEGSPVQRDAVQRLEKLMGEFMEMDFSKAPKAAQRAAKSAKAQILEHQAKNDAWSQAAALNEFMAWSLANQPLGRELGNTLANGVLRFAKAVKILMARLLGSVSYDMFSNVLFNTRAILEPDLTQEPSAVDPKTNKPTPSASIEEALTGEVVMDEDTEGVIFGQGGMLVPYNGGNGNLIGGGNGSGGGGGNGGSGFSQDPSGTPQYNNFWINLIRSKLNDLRPAAVGRTAKTEQFIRYLNNARKSYDQMIHGGFVFTEEQRITYEAIHMIFALEVQLDARALQSMGKVFNHVVENLRPEMFTGEAQDKYQSFMDALGKTTNDEQISDAIATFFAMSQTNDEFRFVLEQLPKPADKKASSFSEFVSTITVSLMRKAVGSINPNDKNARDAMDMLSRVILAQDTKEEFRILRLLMRSFDVADKYTSGKLRQMSDLVSDYAYNLPDEQRMKKKIAESVALVTNLFSDQRADLTYEFIKTITHNGNTFDDFVFLRELVSEMIGTDKNNEKIVALMDVVKKQVSALREGHRENVPLTLQGNFKTKPTAKQWAVAHAVLAKTDFSVLFDLQYADQSMSLISDSAYRTRQIKIYTDTIKRELGRSAALAVLDKAQQLADFMNGKGAGFQLLRNAFAINEIEGDKSKPGLVIAIDKLVSLLALDGKSPEELQTISDMYEADPEAMKSVLVYMKKLNQNEDEKLQVSETILTDEYGDEYDYDPVHRMRMNGYKGYVPNLGNPDVTITVEDDAYRSILEKRGFIRVGDYTADDMVSVASKGYYVSSTHQNGGYAQGVMQSIQNTYRGVNAGTGITVNGTTSGIIMGYENLDRVISTYNRAGMVADPKETLLPVYDGDSVIYYERALNPDVVEKYTQPAGNLALQLGVWSGRQVEEKAAQSYNALLIDQLKAVWDNREPGSDGLFIDIRAEYYAWIQWERATKEERKTMRKPDAIYADSWKVIPPQTKAYIAGVFGEDGFMVRRDQINTALGYAEPSIADFWTGKTRFSEGTASVVRAVADMTLGRLKSGTSALTLLQTAAGGLQETVSFAKDLIVTRSLVVPYLNSQANIFTLNLRGVPNKMIATGYRDKLIEIEQYNQNFKKIMFLNTQYDLAEGDANKQGIIRREIQVLKDQNKRMSIYPLVEAGAYKNISEGITEEDFEILKSGLAALVEKQVDRLPDIAKTIVRNGLVSQTTDIYRVANKAVQYGDFLAKGVYFDYLTKIQGMSEEAALSRINEEYVNFSTPPGRVRSALDKYGATWFMTYKIRIAKVAMAQARQNPVRALLVNTLDEDGRNTAQHSNLFANMLDGSIEYSLGWEMMMNSPGLNPWLNMMDW